jgi:hypothetical protein
MSWKEVAQRFRISWEKVFHSVEYAVNCGLEHRAMKQDRYEPVLTNQDGCYPNVKKT